MTKIDYLIENLLNDSNGEITEDMRDFQKKNPIEWEIKFKVKVMTKCGTDITEEFYGIDPHKSIVKSNEFNLENWIEELVEEVEYTYEHYQVRVLVDILEIEAKIPHYQGGCDFYGIEPKVDMFEVVSEGWDTLSRATTFRVEKDTIQEAIMYVIEQWFKN